jgi:hypothetical protein
MSYRALHASQHIHRAAALAKLVVGAEGQQGKHERVQHVQPPEKLTERQRLGHHKILHQW